MPQIENMPFWRCGCYGVNILFIKNFVCFSGEIKCILHEMRMRALTHIKGVCRQNDNYYEECTSAKVTPFLTWTSLDN